MSNYPTQRMMEDNIMAGKGQLGIQRIPTAQSIPKQSPAPTRTGSGNGNFDVNKKMAKVMSHVTKG